VPFRIVRVDVGDGPNLEARARAARQGALPDGHLTGHTADDQAETVLINLLRGAGVDGLAAMAPSTRRPLLALRRVETRALCAALGIDPVEDPTNRDRRFLRNRVRAELIPLLDDLAGRDVAALLARTADVLRDDAEVLDHVAAALDPTDARALAAAHPGIARRALRRWIGGDGHPPDRATVERAWAVVVGRHRACELGGGRRLQRRDGRLSITASSGVASSNGDRRSR